ncbi:hypothetical protein XU18_2576 [Perkinsela sp. CCAP 1560/4]|nr:hypothetical protein XU18_2576 [Perkinsela sp. CCAP 1560/4]|eukprot:KNH06555.1 hypothetical protein XU18_2576 [Perkinsela sp. CCAP 1560/4]
MHVRAKICSPKSGATDIDLDDSITVDELRETIAVFTGIPEDRQKIHLSSHVVYPLQYANESSKTLRSFGLSNDLKIFVIQTCSPVTSTREFGSMCEKTRKDNFLASLLKDKHSNDMLNFFIESLVNNPEEIANMLKTSPQARHLSRNSQFLKAMENPEMIRDILRSVIDPDARTSAMRNLELRMHQISNMGGDSMIRNLFSEYLHESDEDPQEILQEDSNASEVTTHDRVFAIKQDVEPFPNPWEKQQPTTTGRRYTFPPAAKSLVTASGERFCSKSGNEKIIQEGMSSGDKENFSAQLQELHSMGFQDDAKNVAALTRSHGDVTGAVFILLSANSDL